MKVYVSEEEKELLNESLNKETLITTILENEDEIEYSDCVLLSLNQHDAEIRKPLEDEIESLKFENARILNTPINTTMIYYERAKQEHFEKLFKDQIKQAKQEVIDELLKTIKENEYCIGDYGVKNHYAIGTDILKQKLNQMKEVE
jgi:hypothetical protein